jgi:hypothetical protein
VLPPTPSTLETPSIAPLRTAPLSATPPLLDAMPVDAPFSLVIPDTSLSAMLLATDAFDPRSKPSSSRSTDYR